MPSRISHIQNMIAEAEQSCAHFSLQAKPGHNIATGHIQVSMTRCQATIGLQVSNANPGCKSKQHPANTPPEIMNEVPAGPDIKLDHAGHGCVGDEPAEHRVGQEDRELAKPDVDDRDEHEGGRGKGTDYIYVAGGHVEDAVEDVEAWRKQRGLAAEKHLVWTLQQWQ